MAAPEGDARMYKGSDIRVRLMERHQERLRKSVRAGGCKNHAFSCFEERPVQPHPKGAFSYTQRHFFDQSVESGHCSWRSGDAGRKRMIQV